MSSGQHSPKTLSAHQNPGPASSQWANKETAVPANGSAVRKEARGRGVRGCWGRKLGSWQGGEGGLSDWTVSVKTQMFQTVCKSATVCLMGLQKVQLCERKTWEYKLFSLERFEGCQAAQVLPLACRQGDDTKTWRGGLKVNLDNTLTTLTQAQYKYTHNKTLNTFPEINSA